MTNLKNLEETLAVFGADPERWPAGRALELDAVLQSSEGKALVAEAKALEQVLDAGDSAMEPPVGGDASALLASIMASTVDAKPTATVEGARVSRSQASAARGATRNSTRGSMRLWGAGVGMAAALLVGVFAGLNGFGAVVTQNGISIAQGDVAVSADDALLADLSFLSDVDLGDVDAGDDV